MGYTISFGDITEFNGDAIVNSLGVQGKVYGQLCRNIIRTMDDENIKNYIDSLKNNKIGNIILTEAGKLPCNKVIHVVTPLKHLDDSNNNILRKVYKDIVDTAIKQKFKNIALPFIGTGANGYSEREVYDIILEVCDELSALEEKKDKNILTITIISYLRPKRTTYRNLEYRIAKRAIENVTEDVYFNTEEMQIVRNTYSSNKIKKVSSELTSVQKKKLENTKKCMLAMTSFDVNDLIVTRSDFKEHPFYFAIDYMKAKGFKESQLTKNGID